MPSKAISQMFKPDVWVLQTLAQPNELPGKINRHHEAPSCSRRDKSSEKVELQPTDVLKHFVSKINWIILQQELSGELSWHTSTGEETSGNHTKTKGFLKCCSDQSPRLAKHFLSY